MTENVPMLIQELYVWESQTKWWPNKTLWQRALVALGEPDQWGVGTMDSNEAQKLYQSKGKRDKPRWARIYNALYEKFSKEQQKEISAAKEMKKAELGIGNAKILYLDRQKVSEFMANHAVQTLDYTHVKPTEWTLQALIKGAHTPDTDPRAIATLKREIKNKDELIAQKKREYEDLLNKNKGGSIIQADLIGRQQVEIDEYKKKIRSLEDKIADMKLVHSIEGTKQTLNKEITRLRAEHIRQQEKAQKYYALYEEVKYKLDNAPPSVDTVELENELAAWKVKFWDLKQKTDDKQIDFQDAISALMSGRVIEPEMRGKVYLSEADMDDLVDFKLTWERVSENLPDMYVYGMKHKESGICKRHGIMIDDYGQPTTAIQVKDFARTLQYMDNAIAHAHQELQAVTLVADMLIKVGRTYA